MPRGPFLKEQDVSVYRGSHLVGGLVACRLEHNHQTAIDRKTTLGLVPLAYVLSGAVMIALLPLPSAHSFVYSGLSIVVHFAYFCLPGRAYHNGDLGVVYFIARGGVRALVSL